MKSWNEYIVLPHLGQLLANFLKNSKVL